MDRETQKRASLMQKSGNIKRMKDKAYTGRNCLEKTDWLRTVT